MGSISNNIVFPFYSSRTKNSKKKKKGKENERDEHGKIECEAKKKKKGEKEKPSRDVNGRKNNSNQVTLRRKY